METDKTCGGEVQVVELGDDEGGNDVGNITGSGGGQKTIATPLSMEDKSESCGEKGDEMTRITGEDDVSVSVAPVNVQQQQIQGQDKFLFRDEMKFMKDFDPNQRTIKKKMKKFTEDGVIVESCDCLIPTCTGCHFFQCKNCGSHCCGHACRLARTWDYEEVEIQGVPGLTITTRKRKISQF